MDLDLESLACFEAAARTLGFRSAAARVHLSPGAFGERIKRLEEVLGAPLFARTTRKVQLTAAGQRLLPQARRALEEAARCRQVVATERVSPFALTLGTRFELGLSWLVPNLDVLRKKNQARTLHLSFGDSGDLLARLERGELDAFLSSVRLTRPGLAYVAIHEERYVFVGAPKLLEQQPLRSAQDARQHVLLDAHRDLPLFRYFQDAASRRELWTFAGYEYLGTIAAVRQRAIDGAGVAVLPSYFVADDLRCKRLLRLVPSVQPGNDWFRLIWRDDDPRTEELARLGDELRDLPLR